MQKFKNYGNNYEILRAIPINNEFLKEINENPFRINGTKFVCHFENKNNVKRFIELRIKNFLNITTSVGYKDDYIVHDKTGIYIISKEKFEKQYSLLLDSI